MKISGLNNGFEYSFLGNFRPAVGKLELWQLSSKTMSQAEDGHVQNHVR